ncbi:ABC transporter ATP-binding protein [Reyranella sp.]|uniref:ABC transporter ATP-binding protein n=1 Tax=Reyranella sp. TaxID=1929291 RepID=UPI003D0F1158
MTVLATRSLVRRRGARTVLDGIDVAFAGGQLSAIVGPNGAGKTTLLRQLAGLDPPDGGEATLDGARVDRLGAAVRSRRIAYLPQSAAVYWPLLGRDLVALGRLPHGADLSRPLSPTDTAAIERALARVGSTSLAGRRIDELSQGERARLALARVLATEADVILADEPVANLDPAYALEAMTLLRAEAARGVCVVVCLHDLGLTARFADHVVLLVAGRMQASGAAAAVLQPDVIDRAYGVGFRTVTIDGVAQPVAWTYRGQNFSG